MRRTSGLQTEMNPPPQATPLDGLEEGRGPLHRVEMSLDQRPAAAWVGQGRTGLRRRHQVVPFEDAGVPL